MRNLDRLPFPHFIYEMGDYAKKRRVEAVYAKCIRNGKYFLADKIAKKYNLFRTYDKRKGQDRTDSRDNS